MAAEIHVQVLLCGVSQAERIMSSVVCESSISIEQMHACEILRHGRPHAPQGCCRHLLKPVVIQYWRIKRIGKTLMSGGHLQLGACARLTPPLGGADECPLCPLRVGACRPTTLLYTPTRARASSMYPTVVERGSICYLTLSLQAGKKAGAHPKSPIDWSDVGGWWHEASRPHLAAVVAYHDCMSEHLLQSGVLR